MFCFSHVNIVKVDPEPAWHIPWEYMVGLWIQQFGKLQKGRSKTLCSLLQQIMGRILSNKNANIELESFLLDPNGSKGIKGLGKSRRNVIVFNCKKVVQWWWLWLRKTIRLLFGEIIKYFSQKFSKYGQDQKVNTNSDSVIVCFLWK